MVEICEKRPQPLVNLFCLKTINLDNMGKQVLINHSDSVKNEKQDCCRSSTYQTIFQKVSQYYLYSSSCKSDSNIHLSNQQVNNFYNKFSFFKQRGWYHIFISTQRYCDQMRSANFFELVFTTCKAEQPIQGMELPEAEAQKD